MIAKLSLITTLILFWLNLSELRVPFSGPHNGVRIRRGTPPPRVAHKCERGDLLEFEIAGLP